MNSYCETLLSLFCAAFFFPSISTSNSYTSGSRNRGDVEDSFMGPWRGDGMMERGSGSPFFPASGPFGRSQYPSYDSPSNDHEYAYFNQRAFPDAYGDNLPYSKRDQSLIAIRNGPSLAVVGSPDLLRSTPLAMKSGGAVAIIPLDRLPADSNAANPPGQSTGSNQQSAATTVAPGGPPFGTDPGNSGAVQPPNSPSNGQQAQSNGGDSKQGSSNGQDGNTFGGSGTAGAGSASSDGRSQSGNLARQTGGDSPLDSQQSVRGTSTAGVGNPAGLPSDFAIIRSQQNKPRDNKVPAQDDSVALAVALDAANQLPWQSPTDEKQQRSFADRYPSFDMADQYRQRQSGPDQSLQRPDQDYARSQQRPDQDYARSQQRPDQEYARSQQRPEPNYAQPQQRPEPNYAQSQQRPEPNYAQSQQRPESNYAPSGRSTGQQGQSASANALPSTDGRPSFFSAYPGYQRGKAGQYEPDANYGYGNSEKRTNYDYGVYGFDDAHYKKPY